MPKHKVKRGSTNIDMTAMCDVAFLLLTFFMLAAKSKPNEPVSVQTPSAISDITLPDKDIMLITVDPKGRIFFSIDNTKKREELIDRLDEYKNLGLTANEKQSFAAGSSIGIPLTQLKSYLAAPPEQQAILNAQSKEGIPADTATDQANNDLAAWISSARNTNPRLRICIKADSKASYPSVKKVIATLEKQKIFKFNLITNLKEAPAGSAAAMEKSAAAPAAGAAQ